MLILKMFLKVYNRLISNKMTKEELEIEISTLYCKIDSLVNFKQSLVDSENYEDAAQVRDYLILVNENILIYMIMLQDEQSNNR
jgi:hypothetical protein